MKYDASTDVSAARASMEAWSRHGFMAGFCGLRSPSLDGLHSSVFFQSFLAQIMTPQPDADEMRSRIDYGEEMQRLLFDIENTEVSKRYAGMAHGMIARTVAVVLATLAIVGLISCDRPGMGVAVFVVLLLIGSFLPKVTFDRDRKLSLAAFPDRSSFERMPWMSASSPEGTPAV